MAKEYRFQCGACLKHITHQVDESQGIGYSQVSIGGESKIMCYMCSAMVDARNMVQLGKAQMYLVDRVRACVKLSECRRYITNWPGTLIFNANRVTRFDESRQDFWFMGPEGYEWYGIAVLDQQLSIVERTKIRVSKVVPKHEDYIVRYPYTEVR